MIKLVTISGKEMCKLLEKLGFEKVYGKGLLLSILKQIKLSKEDYDKVRLKI